MKTISYNPTVFDNMVNVFETSNDSLKWQAGHKALQELRTYGTKLNSQLEYELVNSLVTVAGWTMSDLFNNVDCLPAVDVHGVKIETGDDGKYHAKHEVKKGNVRFMEVYKRLEKAGYKLGIEWRLIGLNILYNIQFAGYYENTPATMKTKDIINTLSKVHYTSRSMLRTMAETLKPSYTLDKENNKVFLDLTDEQVISAYVTAIRVANMARQTKETETKETETKETETKETETKETKEETKETKESK